MLPQSILRRLRTIVSTRDERDTETIERERDQSVQTFAYFEVTNPVYDLYGNLFPVQTGCCFYNIDAKNYEEMGPLVSLSIDMAQRIVIDGEYTGIYPESDFYHSHPERFSVSKAEFDEILKGNDKTERAILGAMYLRYLQMGLTCLRQVGGIWKPYANFTIHGRDSDEPLNELDFNRGSLEFLKFDIEEYNRLAAPKSVYREIAKKLLQKSNYDLMFFNGHVDIIQLFKVAGIRAFERHLFFEQQLKYINLIDVKFIVYCIDLQNPGNFKLKDQRIESIIQNFGIRSDPSRYHSAGYDTYMTWLIYVKLGREFGYSEISKFEGYINRIVPEENFSLYRSFI